MSENRTVHITLGDATACGQKLADIPDDWGMPEPMTAPRTSYPQITFWDEARGAYVQRSPRDVIFAEARETVRRHITCDRCLMAWLRDNLP